jgi:nitroimidazol reductase NimA-like FMN-containing flavoprotein (pyridoxamine 5'-phosphate oxidase superfamily)
MGHESGGLLGGAMSEGALDWVLTDQRVCVLPLSADGEPYGVPLSFGYDAPDRLYFLFVGHSETGRKVRFAEVTSEASFLIFDVRADGGWQSAVV